jgi:hypothetical protein
VGLPFSPGASCGSSAEPLGSPVTFLVIFRDPRALSWKSRDVHLSSGLLAGLPWISSSPLWISCMTSEYTPRLLGFYRALLYAACWLSSVLPESPGVFRGSPGISCRSPRDLSGCPERFLEVFRGLLWNSWWFAGVSCGSPGIPRGSPQCLMRSLEGLLVISCGLL